MWFSSLQLLDFEWVSTGLCKLCSLFEQALWIKVVSSGVYKHFTLQLLSLTIYTCGAFEPSNQDCRLRDQSTETHCDCILSSPSLLITLSFAFPTPRSAEGGQQYLDKFSAYLNFSFSLHIAFVSSTSFDSLFTMKECTYCNMQKWEFDSWVC